MELIIFIIIIFVVKNKLKNFSGKNQNNHNQGAQQPYQQQMQRRPVNMTQQRRSVNTVSQHRPMTTQAKPVSSKPVQPEADGADHSTTDYLEQKAMADQREHAKEKMEERKRLSEKYGGRAIAMRYLPGDRIPHGMRVVNCSYCNAENLVETIRTERACYFCRTKL